MKTTPMSQHPILAVDRFWAINPDWADDALRMFNAVSDAGMIRMDPQASGGEDNGGSKNFIMAGSVAIIPITGPMTKQWSCASWLMGGTFTARTRRQVRSAMNDDDVTAVMLLIDSPGGSVSGTADLAADVAALAAKKQVTAYIEDMGCSAAYWIASQASRIVCNPSAMVGSIGCYMVAYDMSAQAAMRGIKVHKIATGGYKGAGTDGTEITAEHLEEWQRTVDTFADQFCAAIASGRGMPRAKVDALATGEVWIGTKAKEAGLVDSVESLDVALNQLQRGKSSSRTRAEAAGEANQQEGQMSDKKEKVGLIANLMAKFGVNKADLEDAGETNSSAESQTTSVATTSEASDDPRITASLAAANAALSAAAQQLAVTTIKTFTDKTIAAGRLTTAEREQFEAAYMACLKADGGGDLKLTETGSLVEGPASEAFVKLAGQRPAHKLFQELVPGAKVDESTESEATRSYRTQFNKAHGVKSDE